MIEYRTERVAPQNEDNIIEILGAFGWQPVSSQEVYNESTEIAGVDVTTYGDGFVGGFMKGFTGKDGTINIRQRKNITNYVTLRFARDTNMPNYSELKELNEEFESKLSVDEPKKPVKRTAVTVIGMAIILISVIMALVESNSAEIWEIIICVLFPLITIPLTVISWVKYKKNKNYYYYIQDRLNTIYNQALLLLE